MISSPPCQGNPTYCRLCALLALRLLKTCFRRPQGIALNTQLPRAPVWCACLCIGLLPFAGFGATPDAAASRKIAEQFVAGKQAGHMESYEATEVATADLNGDGQDEIIVLWTMYGPTYSDNGVAVLAKQGARYAATGETQDPLGQVEGMTVSDGLVQLKTKWPGPNDPRCCPSVAKTLRYRWTPGKLTPVK
jgi:hypothetical protein